MDSFMKLSNLMLKCSINILLFLVLQILLLLWITYFISCALCLCETNFPIRLYYIYKQFISYSTLILITSLIKRMFQVRESTKFYANISCRHSHKIYLRNMFVMRGNLSRRTFVCVAIFMLP